MTATRMWIGTRVIPFSLLLLAALPAQDAKRAVPLTRVMGRMELPVRLGPTGMSGYVYRDGIVVRQVEPKSPADGIVLPFDYIRGIQGQELPRAADPRRALGAAIEAAEGGDGKLKLTVLRNGREKRLVLQLKELGALSKTWPFDCKKSERILNDACAYLIRHQYESVLRTNHVTRGCNALLLLARGEPQDMELVRRAAYLLTDDALTAGYQGWSRSYSGIFLAEYYLATKDKVVLPKLRELARTIPAGQMACGSWGHRMPWDGYGAVNQIGLACYLAMILIEDCGISVDAEAMERSRSFFARYAGKGWIPYGDHLPWRGTSGNGKNALAAVAYGVLGGHERVCSDFARSTAASYESREMGHTGAFFSFLWGPIGAARAPRGELQRFLDQQRWYYALSRQGDGGFVCQPNPENLSGRTPGTYTNWGADGTTGGMALFLALPKARLRIFGKSEEGDESPQARMKTIDAFAMQAMRQDLKRGDYWLAEKRMMALERSRGKPLEELRRIKKRIEAHAGEVARGEDYHRQLRNAYKQPRAWRALEKMAKAKQSFYGHLAMETLAKGTRPAPKTQRWRPLWDSRKAKPFAHSGKLAKLRLRARCASGSKVYLNDVCIAEFGEQVGKRNAMDITLPKSVQRLLRPRGNRMRLEGTKKRDWIVLSVTGGRR